MLYIVGGTSRSGKSTISKMMLEKIKTPYLSLDWIMMGFTNGIPEFGIHDRLWANEIAERMWNFVKAMCENILYIGQDYVVEGEAILPEHISELAKKFPGQVKACYVGYADVDVDKKVSEVKTYSSGPNDWLANEPEEQIISHIENMVKYSRFVKEECEKYQVEYFDTSKDFMGTLNEAVKFLTES